jgi:hypothetical protein
LVAVGGLLIGGFLLSGVVVIVAGYIHSSRAESGITAVAPEPEPGEATSVVTETPGGSEIVGDSLDDAAKGAMKSLAAFLDEAALYLRRRRRPPGRFSGVGLGTVLLGIAAILGFIFDLIHR